MLTNIYTQEGPAFVGYHQDMKYWGMDPKISVTAWIAVDPAGPSNGSMVFLPGSHTAGLQDHGTTDCENNILQGSQHIFLGRIFSFKWSC